MMRLWIGTALLAGSWLLGLNYFYPPSPWAWFATVVAAVVLFGIGGRSSDDVQAEEHGHRPLEIAALVLLLPAAWFAPWPYRAAPLLVVFGLALQLLPIRRRWSDLLGRGALLAGVVMFVQALALETYIGHTMRSHELPSPLPDMLAGIAGLLGVDATADGSTVVMHSMRQVHRLGATWELLFDPVTFLFFIGGLATLAWWAQRAIPVGQRWRAWIGGLRTLTLVVLAWLPLRAGLLMALYLHRVVRSDPNRPLHAINHCFSPWILLLLLIVPVLLAWRFVRLHVPAEKEAGNEGESEPATIVPSTVPLPAVAGLIALAVALLTAAIYWAPLGHRKEGRVMVVERHSEWEPTTKEYDTTWFVEPRIFGEGSGYNYARIYRYLDQFYAMSRLPENGKIDDATLAKCDVLVIKDPTIRYSPKEVEAVQRFVEQGGGLLLVGDHTNFERSSTIMNDIARPMGFIFRDDLLFSFQETPYDQLYVKPTVAHPVVQDLPPMDFAVSCSIDPGSSNGRAVIANTGLWNMGPEYHFENFHPVPQYCPEMQYGAFIQVWAATHGLGRVLAFTDSTIFSNFCVGQPGKAELMLGMVEWLNHANPWVNPRLWLFLLALPPLVVGLWMARGRDRASWLVLLAAGTCGWVVAAMAVIGLHRWNMPTPKRLDPERRIVIDRTLSDVPLSKGPSIQGDGEGYGLLEQWFARLGCNTVRKQGSEAFSGDVLAVLCPSRSVTEEFRQRFVKYVADGGRLLVIDSPENVGSTANSLLWPFGLSLDLGQPWKGKLSTQPTLPVVDVEPAYRVIGGRPVAKLGEIPVAAVARHGKGSVMAIGFGSLWNDIRMGETWLIEPDAASKERFEVLFGLLRPFFDGRPLPPAASPPAAAKDKAPDSDPAPKADADPVLKESGPAEL